MIRCLSILFSLGLLLPSGGAADRIDYMEHIRPILADACYQCHGPTQNQSGLRLDTAAFALTGGYSGPAIIPGNAAESLIIKAVQGTVKDMDQMPLKRSPLSEKQIALLTQWIDEGAEAPEYEVSGAALHWAFVRPERPELPEISDADWPRNPIDHFVLARLEEEGIEPSPEADRITLIRRVSLDLTGLPPTLEEVDEFVEDARPDAYERLVERLLASPHYGERWGRHWLDVARYADSSGYSIDGPRSIWKYRDWVIKAVNQDLPFDWFTIYQLAGDLLPNPTLDQIVATGFHRNTMINQEGGIDREQFRVEAIVDRVNTTGTAFLGLTVACAQCHDHKFDPISHKEYFELFAFFNNDDEPQIEVATEMEKAERDAIRARITALQRGLNNHISSLAEEMAEWEEGLSAEQIAGFNNNVKRALKVAPDKRNAGQREQVFGAFRGDDEEFKRPRDEIARLEKEEPKFPTTLVLRARPQPRETFVMINGDFTRRGETVTQGVPRILHPMPDVVNADRLDLAKWIVDPANPLTARVVMNRKWQMYFGTGILETENDFGIQSPPPSHPELLDWLATEFIRQKWSQKAMHRLIVTSATYRQASNARPDLRNVDPYNRLLARQSRLRLDAEIVRDVALSASGLLADAIGGPSVFPPVPEGVMALGQVNRAWNISTGPDRYRRGMYTFFFRSVPYPGLAVFDAPEGTMTCTRRIRSNTPLQSLTLLNDQAFFEFAQGLALRVLDEAPQEERLDYAFRLCLSRSPSETERGRLEELLELELAALSQSPEEARQLAPKTAPPEADIVEMAAWTSVSRVLLNLDETITRE